MSQTANTFDTFAAKGIRESLSNVIYNISPEETPFMSNIGRENVKNTYFEWQTDSLAAASTTNAQVEGDDVSSYDSTAATARIGNYTQVSRKTVLISGTLESVDKAGRRSELAYQLAKRSAELKRDMESIMLTNQAAAAGSAGVSTALRKTGSLLAFLKTNTDKGTGGADPVYPDGWPGQQAARVGLRGYRGDSARSHGQQARRHHRRGRCVRFGLRRGVGCPQPLPA